MIKSRLYSLSSALLIVCLISSCKKLDKVLIKKEGDWNITRIYQKYTDPDTTENFEETDVSPDMKIIFTDDGKGYFAVVGSGNTYFNWTADDHASTLTLTDPSAFVPIIVYDVTNQKTNSMNLKYPLTTLISGGAFTQEMDLERTK